MPGSFTATTPIGFIGKAEAFRAGAQLLARDIKGVGGWARDPARYLYHHCIGLYLKAALISVGKTEDELRKMSHGFGKLVEVCNLAGLGLNEPGDLAVINMIDADRNYIRARYHYFGAFRVATIQVLDNTAHEVSFLAVGIVRRSGQQVRAPLRPLPIEHRFQVS